MTSASTTRLGLDPELWIRRFHPAREAAVRLVCFPHAGGAASAYFAFSRALPSSVEALSVQYPGREDRRGEPVLTDVRELADSLAGALAPWHGERLAFFGHSMGAIVAFEVADRLRQHHGVSPVAFFASARRAPSAAREEHVHLLDDHGLLAELKALSGTATALFDNPEIVRMVLPAIRGDYRAIETYEYSPGAVLDCPVTAFAGAADHRVAIPEVRAWRDHTTGEFALRVFPGGHFYLHEHRAEVVRQVVRRLAELG